MAETLQLHSYVDVREELTITQIKRCVQDLEAAEVRDPASVTLAFFDKRVEEGYDTVDPDARVFFRILSTYQGPAFAKSKCLTKLIAHAKKFLSH